MENTEIKEELENQAEEQNTAGKNEPRPNETETQKDETEKLKEELAGSKDKFIRLYSEFENFRRRTAKEKLEMVQSANEQLIKSLLPIIDDFERAEKSFKDQSDTNTEGFFLIQNKFRKVLDLYGVKAMDVQPGTDFNTDMHEAITQVPAGEDLKGKVVDVVEKGYVLNDKVIRFAKVVVGS